MKKEYDDALVQKYPKIFKLRHNPNMAPISFGFECGNGWYKLIDKLCSDIQAECDLKGFQVVALQVKEKYGSLRFYIGAGDYTEHIFDLIQKAEAESEKICETCGEPGKIRGGGWLYCACDAHIRKEHKNVKSQDNE